MRARLLLLVVAGTAGACGSTPPPKVVAQKPEPAKPPVATCNDVGVILRGEVDSGDADAGRDKERTIERSCTEDKWPQSIIDCIASTPKPRECVDKLDETKLAAFEKRLDAWIAEHGDSQDYVAAAPSIVACADVTVDVREYAPPIGATADERTWHLDARREFLAEECEHGWSEPLKECLLIAGPNRTSIAECLADDLDAGERDEISKHLTELDRIATKLAATKQKPASFSCAKVVAHHYADALWKQKLDGFKPAERTRMIKDSRTLMTKACTAEKWDATKRACVVAGGEQSCFNAFDRARWGLPAIGTVTSVGIPECDDYSATVMKFTKCDKLSPQARESILRSQQQLLAQIARLPASERAKMGESCKAGMDAVTSTLTSSGC